MLDINELLTSDFSKEIKHPVELDLYEPTSKAEKDDIFFEFTYEDEHPVYFGDDKPLFDNTYVRLKMTTPKATDYFPLKKATVKFLEEHGLIVKHSFSYLDQAFDNKVRCTIFEIEKISEH